MVRILHVVSSVSKCNGVMNFIMNYYKKIDNKKFIFDFVYFKGEEEDLKKEIESYGGKIYKIDKPSINGNYKKQFKKILSDNDYNIIHCHPIHAFFFFGEIAQQCGVKHVIQHSHSSKFGNNLISSVRNKILMALFNKRITNYAACSEKALNLFPKSVKRNNDYKIFKNAIDSEKYIFNVETRNKIRKELKIDAKTKVIGHIGRLSREKNHIQLLKIFRKYNDHNKNSKLILVGDGPEKGNIEMYAREIGILDKIIFLGVRDDVSSILSAFDYFIFPSIYEGLGIVAVEAQANGLLTICSLGVPDEAIFTPSALKLDINDIDNIINVLIENSNHKREDNHKLVVNSGYDINDQVQKLEEYYNSLK